MAKKQMAKNGGNFEQFNPILFLPCFTFCGPIDDTHRSKKLIIYNFQPQVLLMLLPISLKPRMDNH